MNVTLNNVEWKVHTDKMQNQDFDMARYAWCADYNEPTTFLDIAHQYELLELFAGLNREGRTIVAVLHDLNQAARFASRLVVMHEVRIRGDGPPAQVLTSELVEEVFGLACDVVDDPQSGTPMVVPHASVVR